jgi:hypothetical protein
MAALADHRFLVSRPHFDRTGHSTQSVTSAALVQAAAAEIGAVQGARWT